ncbi:MAG: NADH:flavin oxidoreductase, partial [Parasphingorhabdus sp.]
MTISLSDPLSLPCGATLPNRLSKAAMTEGLASPDGVPTGELERLYGLWSDGGAGMLLSGNIQIDHDHLERPGNVVIDGAASDAMMAALRSWAGAATRNDNHFWAQISHAGRQTQSNVNKHPKAPSAVKLGLPGGQFGEPVALTGTEIEELVDRFALAAKTCQDAGFTGAQIHAAHGYLLSSFLSPRANQRTDEYGGSLENRARFLLAVVAKTRAAVGPDFPISVKLNSADFQKGGFNFDDSLQVVKWLENASVDLVEISGGTYE